ncbi:MAG: MerR family transcriptional regulator [Nannocystaceae bacterium]|nr:MerR family transcriptional regulator [Nannocystaceae bacterium]
MELPTMVATTPERLKMAEFARRSGVPSATIKHYVREGLLPEPDRTSRNMAYYDVALVPRVRAIKKLQRSLHLPLQVIGPLLERLDAHGMPPDEAVEGSIARVLAELAPERSISRASVIESGVPPSELAMIEGLGLLTPVVIDGTHSYQGDDAALLKTLGEAREAGLSPSMLPPEILATYLEALRGLVRAELAMFRAGVVPLAGGDLGRLTEVATTLSERLVVLLRRKLLLPTLKTLVDEPRAKPTARKAAKPKPRPKPRRKPKSG